MKILAISILGAIGLFTGGCSFVFLVPGRTYVPELQIPGFLIAALCGWAVYALAKSIQNPPAE
ncbi:hypothetical protein [Roseovarius sp. 2305UL8-3]|uniref:hypothetical protein n=1 Tax=Roseovarius conchicola TaxID=3121636 RepID=UPI0035273E17